MADPESASQLASGVTSLAELAGLLRQLRRREARRRGGTPLTYRELATRTGWSHAIVGQYLSGNVLPPTDRFDTLVRLLGAAPAEQGALATARDRVQEARRAGRTSEPVPRQLPPDVRGFAGRDSALTHLDGLLSGPTGTVVISAVSGTAGVGKTALAVHWAHRVADRYPDGQLYVNLRGYDPSGTAMGPDEAVRGFLDAMGVPADRVPSGLTAQVGLYRSLLAGRRVLVVLDNARDAAQVEPLLPATAGCLAIATSRDRLTGLVRAHGAYPLGLDLLSPGEARQLLVRRLGADRVGLEPEAVDEIIERCARLPLALAVVAARAATHPTFPLAALAAELRTALDALAGADPGTDPRVVFSWSYDALGASAARLLRLLGLHPGPDVTAPAAASLAGLPPERVRAPLAELTHANLLAEHSPGRYRFHDLLRAYAHDLAYAHDSEADRRAALDRLLHHYVQTAHAAAPLLNRHRERESPPPAPDGVTPEPVADAAQATAWFTAEHAVLLASVAAAAGGFDDHVGHLASALVDFLDRQGHWTDWAATQSAALDAARRQGDRSAEAAAHRGVARAYARLGRTADAHEHLLRALDLYRDLDDVRGQAGVQHSLASVTHRLGRGRDALEHATRALGLYRRAGHRTGEAWARNAVGWYHALLGDHEAAVEYCRQALDLHRELGDRTGEADSSDSLGYALHHLGRHDEATARYRYALDLFRQLDDRYFVADTLSHLADTYLAAGDRDAARDALTQSLDILDQLGHADADRVRGSLKDLDD